LNIPVNLPKKQPPELRYLTENTKINTIERREGGKEMNKKSFVTILMVLGFVVTLISGNVQAQAATTSSKAMKAYKKALQKILDDENRYYKEFALTDLDGDGKNELIVYWWDDVAASSSMNGYLYSWKNNKLQKSSFTGMASVRKGKFLLCARGAALGVRSSWYYYNGSKLTEKATLYEGGGINEKTGEQEDIYTLNGKEVSKKKYNAYIKKNNLNQTSLQKEIKYYSLTTANLTKYLTPKTATSQIKKLTNQMDNYEYYILFKNPNLKTKSVKLTKAQKAIAAALTIKVSDQNAVGTGEFGLNAYFKITNSKLKSKSKNLFGTSIGVSSLRKNPSENAICSALDAYRMADGTPIVYYTDGETETSYSVRKTTVKKKSAGSYTVTKMVYFGYWGNDQGQSNYKVTYHVTKNSKSTYGYVIQSMSIKAM
jgi:cell division protein FtsB